MSEPRSSEISSASIVVRLAKVVEIVLNSVGLTPNQYRMLGLIAAGAPPVRELSVRLVIKPPNITTLVDGLVGRGLVTRRRSADDGRRQVLGLTAAGHRLVRDADRRCDLALGAVAALDPGRGSTLIGRLRDWVPALDRAATDLRGGQQRGRGRRRLGARRPVRR